MAKIYTAIGLMSGTSLDGIDAALLQSDGHSIISTGKALTVHYAEPLRHQLREAVYGRGDIPKAAHAMTIAHAEVVKQLLHEAAISKEEIDFIGFHGQSIDHRPAEGITVQIGNPALLAELTGIDVIADFRSRDVAAGGQGAPLVPVFHAALVKEMNGPIAVLNIGGIANITWVSAGNAEENNLLAFDTGPGNVLLNEWMGRHTSQHIDKDGMTARKGRVDESALSTYLKHPYFSQKPPKSLDRNAFSLQPLEHLSLEDGAATLAAFTVQSILLSTKHFPEPPQRWIIAGGGRHNPVIMESLRQQLGEVLSADQAGWDGDALEAQAFAFLAIRSYLGLPLSFPGTTGVTRPVSGGALWKI